MSAPTALARHGIPLAVAGLANDTRIRMDASLAYHAPGSSCPVWRSRAVCTVSLVQAIVYGTACPSCWRQA